MNQLIASTLARFFFTALLCAALIPSRAQESDGLLPLDPVVTRGVLDNGLTYYVRHNDYPENRAVLWLVVNAGSILEEDDQLGLAHFVEHMAFNGTRRFEKNSMIDFAERAGINFGADLNAYTSFDETVYMLTVPTDEPDILSTGLDILEDWAGSLLFDPVEVDKERGVVIEEWRRSRGAGQRISDQQREILLQGSKYALRNTIGEKEILETAPVDTLKRYYQDWYRPELMAVIVVGDVDKEYIESQIRTRFNDLESRGRQAHRQSFDIPLVNETRVSVLTDTETSRSGISIAIKGPHSPVRTADQYRYFLVHTLFTMMLNARLDELRREPDAPFTRAFTGISDLGRTLDIFQLSAVPKPDSFNTALETLLTEFERARRHGFTQSEVERQKASLLSFYHQAYAERDKIDSGSFARESMDHFLKRETMPGIALELELVTQQLPDISLDEINDVAELWSRQQDRIILASGPARDMMPEPDQLLVTAESVSNKIISPYLDELAETDLLANIPDAGNIIERSQIPDINVTTWRLSNGVRVVIKPTTFKNDEILLQGFSPGGLSLAPDDEYPSAAAAVDIVYSGGLGNHNASDLGKILAGKVAWVRPYINELEEGVSGRSSAADLETLLQLVYLSFTGQRKDPAAFNLWYSRAETAVRNRDLDPQRYFNQEYQAFSTNHHPRRLPLDEDQLVTVNLDDAFRFVQERFADAGDFTFVITGNVDLDALEELAVTYLASLPAAGHDESWQDIGITRPQGITELKIEKGSDPKSLVRITYHGEMPWSLEREMDLQLLDNVVDIRLREVLREDMGGVYSASSSGVFLQHPRPVYLYNIGFNCAPENVETLRQAVFTILDSIQETGIEKDYLDRIREQHRRRLEIDLKENGFWHSQLIRHYRYGTDPSRITDIQLQAIERITSDNLQHAARLFLGDNRIDGILMPAAEDQVLPQ